MSYQVVAAGGLHFIGEFLAFLKQVLDVTFGGDASERAFKFGLNEFAHGFGSHRFIAECLRGAEDIVFCGFNFEVEDYLDIAAVEIIGNQGLGPFSDYLNPDGIE